MTWINGLGMTVLSLVQLMGSTVDDGPINGLRATPRTTEKPQRGEINIAWGNAPGKSPNGARLI